MALKKKIDFGDFEKEFNIKNLIINKPLNYNIRDENEILREFNNDKWSKTINLLKRNDIKLNDVENIFLNLDKKILCYDSNNKNKLRFLNYRQALNKQFNILKSKIIEHKSLSKNIIEIGAGFGSKILKLAEQKEFRNYNFYASDISQNGRKFMNEYSKKKQLKVKVGKCNFFKNDLFNYDLPKKSILFSFYSFHYILKIKKKFIQKILDLEPSIILNFEPCYYNNDLNDIHQILKQRYIEVNRYNQNLKIILDEFSEKKLISVKFTKDRFGLNPLLPFTIYEWKKI